MADIFDIDSLDGPVSAPAATPAPAAAAPAAASPKSIFDIDAIPSASAKQEPPVKSQTLFGTIKSAVTGEGRREFDFPELPGEAQIEGDDRSKWLAGRLDFARRPAEQLDILREFRPDLAKTAQFDSHGNVVVEWKGKPYYLNRPGLSMQDLNEAGAGVAASVPGAMLLGPLGARAGLAGRALTSAAIGGSGSILQDIGAIGLGSKQGVDLPAAGVAAAAGGAFELAAPLFGRLWQSLVRRPEMVNQKTGELTARGRIVMQQAGFDPDQVTAAFRDRFAQMARNAANPEDAARLASSASLPRPIPMTRGDITQSPSQQMFESQAAKGAYGQQPETIMRGIEAQKQDAMRGNVAAIQGQIAGRPSGRVANVGAAEAQARLAAMREGERAAVNTAYQRARDGAAFLPRDAVSSIRSSIVEAEDFALRTGVGTPRANALLGEFDDIVRQSQGDSVPIKRLFDWRRRVTTAANEVADRTEASALRSMVRSFDQRVNDDATRALLEGDDAAIEAWQAAIGARREFGNRWEGDNLVAMLTETTRDGGRTVLKVDAADAANAIFTASRTGWFTKRGLVRDLSALRDRLGADSPEWNAIREEAFIRLAQSAEGAYQGAQRDFSGVLFKKAWDNLRMTSPRLVETLFPGEDGRLINQFAYQAAQAYGKVRGGENYSNTTAAMANALQRAGILGPRVAAFLQNAPGFSVVANIYNTGRAASAAAPTLARPPALVGVRGAAGNAAAPGLLEVLD